MLLLDYESLINVRVQKSLQALFLYTDIKN